MRKMKQIVNKINNFYIELHFLLGNSLHNDNENETNQITIIW